jgi:hypothetical protein
MIHKPSEKEEEYFIRKEVERLKKLREEAAREMAAEEIERNKELHFMHCPKCGMELNEITYRGVEVDSCFTCGGMYFDAGEVEKILEFKEPGALDKFAAMILGREA